MPKRRQKYATFNDWINDKGTIYIAGLLNVNPSTVRHWRRGHCYPGVEQMRAIKKITKGAVTYDIIIDNIDARGAR